jgi:demethylspheroidene O-methyltransferase
LALSDNTHAPRISLSDRFYAWRTALLGSRGFQRAAARAPFAARIARKDGEALFDLVAGFVHSQVLRAFVDLDMAARLADRPKRAEELALEAGLAPERMRVLCQAAASLKLMQRRRDGRYALGRLGAALPGLPGLSQMITHHDVLYRDLEDASNFFADGSDTELAGFWPYVFGATGDVAPETAET